MNTYTSRATFRMLSRQEGLTLIEVLVATVLIGMMLSTMFVSVRGVLHAWATGQHRLGIQQNGRNAIEWVTRRIRVAGQGWDVTEGPVYVAATCNAMRFRANLGDGLKQYEYTRMPASGCTPDPSSGARLVERVYGHTGNLESQRDLTVGEEVGIITISDLNFCYYDIFNELLNPPQDATTGRCTGSVASAALGKIYRVQMRLAIASGRSGETRITLEAQAFNRAQELP